MNLNQVKKLMERKKTSHKGENGRLLIIGGSEEYVGSVTLAGLAALRTGCDVVTIATPEKVGWAVHRYVPDLITHKMKSTYSVKAAKEMVKYADRFDAVVIGNGMSKRAVKFCNYFVKKSLKPKVIDATALRGLSFKDYTNSIVTPHYSEMETMMVNSEKDFLLQKLKDSNTKEKGSILHGNLRYFLHNNNVLLLKSATDILISRNKVAFNRTGNQGMTKAGTGDVLAGLVGGFLAKTKDLFKSGMAGAYINGYVGDLLLKKKKGYSFIASDILEDLKMINKIDKKKKK